MPASPEHIDTVLKLVLMVERMGRPATGWRFRELADVPTTVLSDDESNPAHTKLARGLAAPWTFFGMVGAYALLSFAMIGGWLFYDHRPDA